MSSERDRVVFNGFLQKGSVQRQQHLLQSDTGSCVCYIFIHCDNNWFQLVHVTVRKTGSEKWK